MEGTTQSASSNSSDPLAWLEDPNGHEALSWVSKENQRTLQYLSADGRYAKYRVAARHVLERAERIPGIQGPSGVYAELRGPEVYAFWADDRHPRGIWHRTSLEEFKKPMPHWQVVLDFASLIGPQEKAWTFGGVSFSPGGARCLIKLAIGGGMRAVWKEFDLRAREFVPHGFVIPEAAYSSVVWVDDATILVGSDFGNHTISEAGFPLAIKRWSRGSSLSDAPEIFRGDRTHVQAVMVNDILSATGRQAMIISQLPLRRSAGNSYAEVSPEGAIFPWLERPPGSVYQEYQGQLIISLAEDWSVGDHHFTAGSVVAVATKEMRNLAPTVTLVKAPADEREAILDAQVTSGGVLVFGMSNVSGRLWQCRHSGPEWACREVALPRNGAIRKSLLADPTSEVAYVTYESLLQAPTLYEINPLRNRVSVLKQIAPDFTPIDYVTEQHEADSADGTRVPYFIVRRKGLTAKNATAPTLLYGYGAFGLPVLPLYDGIVGKLWLEQGGVYVIANVRGGGEFGHLWHVQRADRQRTYDDFVAVAKDLLAGGTASPSSLGVMGLSAGGLLAATTISTHPQLFGAACLLVPVLDNFRLDLHGAGAIVQGEEYGSPDVPEEREFLGRTSPMQNIPDRIPWPGPLIIGNRTDNNVSPAQARRYVARLQAKHMNYFYYEAREGGHDVGGTPEQKADAYALIYTYFHDKLFRSAEP